MNISVPLSEQGIDRLIRRLALAKENLHDSMNDIVDILAQEGGQVAQSQYGTMATAYGVAGDGEARIVSTGENNLIAEFGAGDGTVEPTVLFENAPMTDVFPGAYSLEVGSGEYWESMMKTGQGRWHFGGKEYTHVPARLGLYSAKQYVIENSTEVAKEAFRL